MRNFKKNSSNLKFKEGEFFPDEIVDIANPKQKISYEGKILAIKNDLIIVLNMQTNKEEIIQKNENRVLKLWAPGRTLKKYNRVDFELNNTNYWIEAVVLDIKSSNNEILIKYKNNNRYKPTCEEWINLDSKRIAPIGLYTKLENSEKYNKLLSSSFNIPLSTINNENSINFLGKKTKSQNNNIILNKEQELHFINLMKKNDFEIKIISGDGNCLFRAISDQVYGSEEHHNIIREKCMDYIVVLKRFFSLFIEGDFDNYIKEKRKSGIWGDDIELEAMSEIYNRPIEIYSGSEKPLRCFHEDKIFYLDKNKNHIYLTPIRISYHGKKHYNSVIPLKDDNNKYKNYKNNIIRTKPGIFEDKIIRIAKENEGNLDEGIKLSEEEYLKKLQKNLSGQKKEEILDQMILNLNENNIKVHDDNNNEDHNKNINENNKKCKKEEDGKENMIEKNDENKKGNKDQKKDIKKDENKEIKENKENENKEKKEDKIKKEDNDKNKDLKDKNNEDFYFSNPVIKAALELGFDLDRAIEAWSLYGDDKELVINYLINLKN